jgi:branched-chain amino acid transport system permease protein
MTGGVNGVSGAPRPVIWGIELSDLSEYYYFVLGAFVVCAFGLYVLIRSPFGLTMRGIKQSQSRMRVLGVNVWLHKYITYIVAGFFAGIAGVLMSSFNGFVSAEDTWLLVSAKGLLIVLAGGPGTLWGSLLGAGAIVLLEDTISSYWERWNIVMGFLYIAVVIFVPGGLMQLLRSASGRALRPTTVQPSTVVDS